MLAPLVALALAAAPDPAAVSRALGAAAPDPAAVSRALGAAAAGAPRAARATLPLVGAPYLVSPLGEGAGPDPDPRFRLDAFDCMTFVETAVALGSAATLREARRALDDVRYSGPPALAARNHEVLSQWIPANVAKGWIADAGPGIAGPLARPSGKTFSPETWAAVRAAGRAIAGLPRSRLPLGRFEANVVASADVPAVAGRIPPGTIAFVVRADAPERATRVTHAGLVVAGARGVTLVRHATSSRGVARVIEEPLERFLAREQRAYPLWPVEGLALYTIRDNTERVRALDGPPGVAAGREDGRATPRSEAPAPPGDAPPPASEASRSAPEVSPPVSGPSPPAPAASPPASEASPPVSGPSPPASDTSPPASEASPPRPPARL